MKDEKVVESWLKEALPKYKSPVKSLRYVGNTLFSFNIPIATVHKGSGVVLLDTTEYCAKTSGSKKKP